MQELPFFYKQWSIFFNKTFILPKESSFDHNTRKIEII